MFPPTFSRNKTFNQVKTAKRPLSTSLVLVVVPLKYTSYISNFLSPFGSSHINNRQTNTGSFICTTYVGGKFYRLAYQSLFNLLSFLFPNEVCQLYSILLCLLLQLFLVLLCLLQAGTASADSGNGLQKGRDFRKGDSFDGSDGRGATAACANQNGGIAHGDGAAVRRHTAHSSSGFAAYQYGGFSLNNGVRWSGTNAHVPHYGSGLSAN